MAETPSIKNVQRMEKYVARYRERTGTSGHPMEDVTKVVVFRLAANIQEVGRPLCPCNFYPYKHAEVDESRRWICACDEMKPHKYCHCLLFVTPEGLPITECLPEDHESREVYCLVTDPTPEIGCEGRIPRCKMKRRITTSSWMLPVFVVC